MKKSIWHHNATCEDCGNKIPAGITHIETQIPNRNIFYKPIEFCDQKADRLKITCLKCAGLIKHSSQFATLDLFSE